MALTNIELYEALKKDLSEESARMIAEVVPKASDLATTSDVREAIADLKADMLERFAHLETHMERRFAESDRRTFRYTLFFAGPLWVATVAALVKFLLQA